MKSQRLAGLLVGIIGMVGFFLIASNPPAYALSGSCGMLVNTPTPIVSSGNSGNSGNIYNTLAVLNFNTNTASWITEDYSTFDNAAGGWAVTTTGSGTPTTSTFTLATGPISGSYQLTMNGHVLNLYPVNSGNTILVQGATIAMSGVCQMQ